MSSQQWWIKPDDMVLGPMPSARLRNLARSGAIGRETPVSFDNERWFPARNIKNLFKADPPPAAETLHTPRPEPGKVFRPGPSDRNSPGDSGANRDGVRVPRDPDEAGVLPGPNRRDLREPFAERDPVPGAPATDRGDVPPVRGISAEAAVALVAEPPSSTRDSTSGRRRT